MLIIAPQGKETQIGEKLLWKYDEARYLIFFPWLQQFNLSMLISTKTKVNMRKLVQITLVPKVL